MIYLDTDHLIRLSRFLSLVQMFDIHENLLPLVHSGFVHFVSATKAKQRGLPHTFSLVTLRLKLSLSQAHTALSISLTLLPNVLEYNSFLHDCNLLIKMIDIIAPFLDSAERQSELNSLKLLLEQNDVSLISKRIDVNFCFGLRSRQPELPHKAATVLFRSPDTTLHCRCRRIEGPSFDVVLKTKCRVPVDRLKSQVGPYRTAWDPLVNDLLRYHPVGVM